MDALMRQLATLPARHGPPPEMTPANPQEQLSQQPDDGQWAAALTAFGLALPAVVARPTLVAPDGALAFTLAPGQPLNPQAVMAGREFAHIHRAPSASLHMMLPAPARAMLLARGCVTRLPSVGWARWRPFLSMHRVMPRSWPECRPCWRFRTPGHVISPSERTHEQNHQHYRGIGWRGPAVCQ